MAVGVAAGYMVENFDNSICGVVHSYHHHIIVIREADDAERCDGQ